MTTNIRLRRIAISLIGAAVITLIAGSHSQTAGQTVSGSIAGGKAARGKQVRATVYLNLPGGLHANSNRPGSEYAIPTTVRVSASGLRIGPVNYPRGVNRKFGFSDKPINVYEGRVPFTFSVTVPAGYRSSTLNVNVTVRYQACTNEVCYSPASKQITLTARVE